MRQLRELAEGLNVRIWHGHDYKSNLFGLLVRRRRRAMRLVTTVHGWTDDTRRMRLYRRVDEWCLRRYERVLAVSGSIQDRCLRTGVRADRLSLVHNGIELGDWTRSVDVQRAQQAKGLSGRGLVLGVIGRLSAEKSAGRLLRAAVGLKREGLRFVIVLLGDGPQRAELEAMAEELGLGEAVVFAGWQHDLPRWYEAMDLVVIPSLREGLPTRCWRRWRWECRSPRPMSAGSARPPTTGGVA